MGKMLVALSTVIDYARWNLYLLNHGTGRAGLRIVRLREAEEKKKEE